MTAENLEEILGPEPVVDEQQNTEAQEQPEVSETPPIDEQKQEPSEPQNIENKQTPEQIVENYKRMAHAERMERKQMQEQMRLMQDRFEQLISASKPQAEPEPDFGDDPLGATHNKVEKALQSVEELKQAELQRQEQSKFQSYVQSVQSDEASFIQKQADYKDAVSFLQGRRLAELTAMGYGQQDAMQVLAQDAYAITMRAQQLGESPAQFVYNMAKQVGYTPKQTQSIETIAEGQKVAKSVAGGAKPVTEGSLPPNLAEMSDSEFEEIFKRMKG